MNLKHGKYNKIVQLIVVSVIMISVLLLYFNGNGIVSDAAWVEGETDANNYEVIQVSDRNDSKRVEDPIFEIKDVSTTTDGGSQVHIEGTTIAGIGNFNSGDKFTIVAKGGVNFKGNNIKFKSTNTDVVKVQGGNGTCTVTIAGPGVASIEWEYAYQRYYTEVVDELVDVETTDENGVTSTTQEMQKVTKTYVDTAYIAGELQTNVNPKILNTSVYMKPNDTMYLRTNVPEKVKGFSADYNREASNLVNSCTTKVIDGYWYILLTSKNAKIKGTITVTAYITDSVTTLVSDPVDITVTDQFSVTPTQTSFNCVNYKKNGNGTYEIVNNSQTISVETSAVNEPVVWEYEYDGGQGAPVIIPITAGTEGVVIKPGLRATINGNTSLILETTSEFFDDQEPSVSSVTFTIRASQEMSEDRKFVSQSVVTVTRPVKGIEIRQAGSSYVLNSQQELYTHIGYTVNGNGIEIPENRFGNDADVLTAFIAGLGDRDAQITGTNGSQVDSFVFEHSPYNSNVRWESTDENVIKIDSISSSTGFSSCNIIAVGAGRATVQAITEDGSFVGSVEYIVRPYPKTVTMKDTTITEKLGELTSKQVTLIAYVTSDDTEENPAQDAYLDKGLIWEISSSTSTSGETVAEVDQNGIVTFYSPGTVVVKATSSVDHNGFNGFRPFAVCTLTVEQPVERITITNKPSDPIMTGDILALKTKIEPSNATDQSVVWSSANESIAKVDKDGKVTAVGPGTTTVRVQTNSGAKYDTCTIEVKRLATSVILNRTEAQVSRGSKLTLLATVLPEDTTDKSIVWTSSDKNIATVSDKGVVTGVKVSKDPVIITATTVNGVSAVCYVTVTEPVTGIKISPTRKTVYVGEDFTIKKTLYPLGNSSINENVTWKSSKPKVASVDANGNVKPLAGGKTTITCTSQDGGFIARCKVTVKEKVSRINLNKKDLTMVIGTKYQLKATVLRKTATNRKVTWKSSKKNIVSVSSTGKLTAKKTGKAKITCTAQDGSKVKAVCNVKVVRKVAKLKLNKTFITLITGNQYSTLKATILPKSATNKKLIWTSSNPSVVSVNKSNGRMFAESAGTAFITVKTTDGTKLSKKCRVKVIDPVPITSLTISQSEITLTKNQKSQLEVRVIPNNTTSAVKWMTDDRSIATVSSNGLVTAKCPGTTVITAYCNDGIESQCTVTVIEMNPKSIAIEQYDEYTLAVDGAANANDITWSSSNANIVTVTNGRIMGVKPGTATITATYEGKAVRCKVTVKKIV